MVGMVGIGHCAMSSGQIGLGMASIGCVTSRQCQGLLMRRYLSGHLRAGTDNDKLDSLLWILSSSDTEQKSFWSCIRILRPPHVVGKLLHVLLLVDQSPSPLVHDLFLQTYLPPLKYSTVILSIFKLRASTLVLYIPEYSEVSSTYTAIGGF